MDFCSRRAWERWLHWLLVVALGVMLHRPVAMIPENTLKFLVGILLCSFGTFWCGRGHGHELARRRRVACSFKRGLSRGRTLCWCARMPRKGSIRTLREKRCECAPSYFKRASRPFSLDDGSLAVLVLAWVGGLLVVVAAETRSAAAFAPVPFFSSVLRQFSQKATVRRAGERDDENRYQPRITRSVCRAALVQGGDCAYGLRGQILL